MLLGISSPHGAVYSDATVSAAESPGPRLTQNPRTAEYRRLVTNWNLNEAPCEYQEWTRTSKQVAEVSRMASISPFLLVRVYVGTRVHGCGLIW